MLDSIIDKAGILASCACPWVVDSPFDGAPCNCYGPLQRVDRFRSWSRLIRHSRDQSITAPDNVFSRIKQHKASRPIGVLRFSSTQTLVPHQCGLLISDNTGNGYTSQGSVDGIVNVAVYIGRRDYAGENGWVEAEEAEERGMPGEGFEGDQEGSRSVCDVHDVQTSVDSPSEILHNLA